MSIQSMLFDLQDEEYALFQSKLVPTIPQETIIGVRTPKARSLAKEIMRKGNAKEFLHALPHDYYDENILQALLISEIKDYDECIEEIKCFLPYVDNWAVCDAMSPKVFTRHRKKLIDATKVWAESDQTYTCRFGLRMLMNHYLDDDFLPEYLEIPASIRSKDYYVQMMIAWYFATALAKQWEATFPYLSEKRLSLDVHNTTIQKALESRRIIDEKKACLKCLKR